MSSIITVLKKVYKEGLESKGFVQLKGRHPYFVRVIGGEIVQVITFRKEPGPVSLREENYEYDHPELEQFAVYGGIATVYRNKIDLSVNPRDNFNWLKSQSRMYVWGNQTNYDEEFMHTISKYVFKSEDEKSMYETAKKSLEITNEIFLPIFNGVKNCEDCIKYFELYDASCMILSDRREYGWDDVRFGTNTDNEALLYILTKNNDDFEIQTKRACQNWYNKCNSEKTGLTMKDYESACKKSEILRMKKIKLRDRILSNEDIYNNALVELERRKNANIENLRALGVNI